MSGRVRHRTVLAGLTIATGLGLLTGCTTTGTGPTATRTVTAVSSRTASPEQSTPAASAGTGASSAVPGPSPSASSAVKVDPAAPAGQCRDSALAVSVQHDPEGDGAGQRGAFVVLRNTGSSSCHLEGTPGLSLVGGGNGTRIGAPAVRDSTDARLVTLAPGGYALADVTYTYVDAHSTGFNTGNGHEVQCRPKAADGYRVYPPHSYRASFTRSATYACSTAVHWISVGAVKPASSYEYFTPKS